MLHQKRSEDRIACGEGIVKGACFNFKQNCFDDQRNEKLFFFFKVGAPPCFFARNAL